jgi:NTP pyrophosphatase (non-canonical NTP hydrolase)
VTWEWDEIIEFNDRFFRGWRDTPLVFLSNALAGETGELCNDTKHLDGGGTHRVQPSKSKMVEELVDVFVYLVLFAEVLGYDEQRFRLALQDKMFENRRRVEAPQ